MEQPQAGTNWHNIPDLAAQKVENWLRYTIAQPAQETPAATLLDGVRADSNSADFTQQLLQLIASADDALLAALGLRQLAQNIPPELPRKDRLALRAGSLTALGLPWAVLPLAKRWLRDRVAHLVCASQLPGDSTNGAGAHLIKTLTDLQKQNTPALVALQGETVLGPEAAHKELRRLLALTYMPEVEYLLVDVGRVAPGSDWASEARAQRAVSAIRQLIKEGAEHGTFITLAASTYSDSLLAAQVANKLLADPDILPHSFGVTLYAEVPESTELLTTLAVHANSRISAGGGSLELRISLRNTSSQESINSVLSGLQLAVLEQRAEIEAAALRLLNQAIATGSISTVLATENPYLLAAAKLAHPKRTFGVEVRLGLATELLTVLAAEKISARVTLPLVAPQEFHAIVPQLLHLTAEAADKNSALGRQKLLDTEYLSSPELRYAEINHLQNVCELLTAPAPLPRRQQNRGSEWNPTERDSALFYRPADNLSSGDTGGLTAAVLGLNTNPDTGEIIIETALAPRRIPVISTSGFCAEPGTDVTSISNRKWFRKQLRAADSLEKTPAQFTAEQNIADSLNTTAHGEKTQGINTLNTRSAQNKETLKQDPQTKNILQTTLAARARVLRRIALTTVAERDVFTRLFANYTNLTPKQIDAQINNIIDTARFLAQQAEGLERVRGATFKPAGRVLLISDEQNYSAEVLNAALAEYAAGNITEIAADNASKSLITQVVAAWQRAGVENHTNLVWNLAQTPEIMLHKEIVRVITFGSKTLKQEVLRTKPGATLNSRSHQFGVATVTPNADYSTAAQQIVRSAFNGDDNGLRQVRAIIAVGSAYRANRFKQQLIDATRAVIAGKEHTTDSLQTALAPLKTPLTHQERKALTELERGETWLLAPRQIDKEGLLWSPGIKAGISINSSFWQTAARLPLLGIVHARSLQDALKVANTIGSGAVASLYSWDTAEIIPWLDNAKAASLTVNRASDSARVERLPSGSWRDTASSVAPLTGSPHQLLALGSWQLREGTPSTTLHLRGLEPETALLIETMQEWLEYTEFDRLRRAALADALTWHTQLGIVRDVSGLGVEHNFLRYWPVASHIRLAEDMPIPDFVRVLGAALLVRAPISVSTGVVLPEPVMQLLARQGVVAHLESDNAWLERVAVQGVTIGSLPVERIRLIGGDAVRLSEWLADRADLAIWAEPVTMAGPIELLSFLREQSVAIANHRNGMMAQQPQLVSWLRELGR